MKKTGQPSTASSPKGAAPPLNRIEEILHTPVTITDPAAPKIVGRLRGDISLGEVTFALQAERQAGAAAV